MPPKNHNEDEKTDPDRSTAPSRSPSPTPTPTPTPPLAHARHVTYFLRCLKTLLPHHYTGMESSRLMLAFFTLAALDLLGPDGLERHTTAADRAGYVDWIYSLQHPDGGFRCSTGTMFGLGNREGTAVAAADAAAADAGAHPAPPTGTAKASEWDVASVPGTYFALVSLAILGDDLSRVRRAETLRWLGRMQGPDGGFFESDAGSAAPADEEEGDDGDNYDDSAAQRAGRPRLKARRKDGGERDPRFEHTAVCARWILGGDLVAAESGGRRDGPEDQNGGDIDVPKLLGWMDELQGYDGGIANHAGNESHAGFAYCVVSGLSLLNNLSTAPAEWKIKSGLDLDGLTRWIAYRQTCLFEFPEEGGEDQVPKEEQQTQPISQPSSQPRSQSPAPEHSQPPFPPLPEFFTRTAPRTAGFAGRPHKLADTCYAFWALGTLAAIGRLDAVVTGPVRRFLLLATQQSRLGGFTKCVGDPYPDLYHSFLGLAALAIVEEVEEDGKDGKGGEKRREDGEKQREEGGKGAPRLKPFDPAVCVSRDVVERIRKIRARWAKAGGGAV